MRHFRWVSTAALVGMIFFQAARTPAQDQAPVKLTLHPKAETKPALKYRLLPGFMEQIPGNAAVFYGKVTAEQRVFFGNREIWDKIDVW